MEIWKLKEFWTVVIDLVVSTALYFGAKYLAAGAFEDVKYLVVALQPVAAFFVAHFAVERAKVETRAMIYKALGRQ